VDETPSAVAARRELARRDVLQPLDKCLHGIIAILSHLSSNKDEFVNFGQVAGLITVLPQPFCPKMSVSGDPNATTCGRPTPKLRTPSTQMSSILAIVCTPAHVFVAESNTIFSGPVITEIN
jgi:hypothetical protein